MPTPPHSLAELLAGAETIVRIAVEMEGDYFVWRLYSNDRELVAVRGRPTDVASMVRSTEMLVNAEFGIPPPEFTAFELN